MKRKEQQINVTCNVINIVSQIQIKQYNNNHTLKESQIEEVNFCTFFEGGEVSAVSDGLWE